MLRLCYDLGVEDVARLSGGEVNGRHSSLVFLNGSIVGATGCVRDHVTAWPRDGVRGAHGHGTSHRAVAWSPTRKYFGPCVCLAGSSWFTIRKKKNLASVLSGQHSTTRMYMQQVPIMWKRNAQQPGSAKAVEASVSFVPERTASFLRPRRDGCCVSHFQHHKIN